ncbi:MAG: hypothetical protein U1E63_01550 [Burkholderiales bacterium]
MYVQLLIAYSIPATKTPILEDLRNCPFCHAALTELEQILGRRVGVLHDQRMIEDDDGGGEQFELGNADGTIRLSLPGGG